MHITTKKVRGEIDPENSSQNQDPEDQNTIAPI